MIQPPQQPQQPQAPGQAPQMGANNLPAIRAGQRGFAPPPQVDQLAKMPVDQLKQLFFQTMSMDMGLQPLTVLAAIKQASENQKLQQAIQGQAFRQQAAQQPGTIRDEIIQMAAKGGEMRSYSGGGIVALNRGGEVQKFQIGSGFRGLTASSDGLQEFGLPYPNDETAQRLDELRLEQNEPKRRAIEEERRLINEQIANAAKRRRAADLEERRTTALAENNQALASQLQQQLEEVKAERSDAGSYPETAGRRYPAPAPAPAPAGPRPQPGGQPSGPRPPATPGIDVSAEQRRIEDATNKGIAALEASKNLPPDVLAGRAGIDKLLGESAAATGAERERMRSAAEKRMQEARERAEAPGYMDPAVLGRILEGIGGAKRFSQAIAGAGAGAGKAMTERQNALRAAEEKYDLQQGELFKLDNARRDIEMKKQERALAAAAGDFERVNRIDGEIASAQANAGKIAMDVRFRTGEFGLKAREVDLKAQELLQKAEANRISAEQLGDTRLATAISAAQARVQQSRNNRDKVLEGAIGKTQAAMYQLDPTKFAKDQPELFQKAQEALLDYQAKVVEPADKQLEALITQASMRTSTSGQKVVGWNTIK